MIGVVAAVFRLDDARRLAELAACVALAAPFGRAPLQVPRFCCDVLEPLIAGEAPRRAGAGPGDRARQFLTGHECRGVSAITATPCGSRTILVTPANAFALASSILCGADPSTGARSTAPYSIPGTWTSML